MHRLLALSVLVLLSGCPNEASTAGPPPGQLYFPSGIVHLPVAGKVEGVLLVANANFDKRFASGSIVALTLDSVGLPALGADEALVKELPELKVEPTQSVQIASFAGEMAVQHLGEGSYRVYVPTRSEGMRVYQALATIGADGVPSLSCINEESRNCVETGVSLSPVEFERSDAGIPRAPSPYGVVAAERSCTQASDCCNDGSLECARSCVAGYCVGTDGQPFADVWVTHQIQADSPLMSSANLRGYLVRLDSDSFSVDENSFINIGPGGSNSIVALGSWVYASGRAINPAPSLIRVVNRDRYVLLNGLESAVRVAESRGVAVSSDRKQIYLAARAPDSLLIASIDESSGLPTLSVVRSVPLPPSPNEVRVIARPGRADVVAVSCSSAGSLVLYDDEVGDLVASVGGVGFQPFGVAVDVRGNAARVYVSDFGDGRIGVVDIPNLDRPQGARLVAHLGSQQLCLTRGASSPGCLASQAVSP